jgi:hypothetical protein
MQRQGYLNEEYVYWKEGVPILFDDSFLHSAVHYHFVNHDDDYDTATMKWDDKVL